MTVGGFSVPEGSCTCLFAMLAVFVAVFALYFFVATRRVKACKTLPERKKQYQIIALYSFSSAPLSLILCLLAAGQLYILGLSGVMYLGFILLPVFILYGLINLSRARDVGRQIRFYSGEDQKRA